MGRVRVHRGALKPLLGILACGLAILVAPAHALAQGAADQYIPSPKPGDSGSNAADPSGAFGDSSSSETSAAGGGGGNDGSGGGKGGSEGKGEIAPASSEAGDDTSVPGTDFPVSPFVLVAGGLILAGVLSALLIPHLRRRRTAV